VVAEDKPQGVVLWVNEQARQSGVLPGLRYAAALSLASGLRAGAVAPKEITQSVAELTRRLMGFSPEVEPSASEPGVFWLNGAGLQRLYSSPRHWTYAIRQEIETQRLAASVAVGFTRFGTYAVAKAQSGITIFRDAAEERSAAEKIPLARLHIDPRFRDALFKLGIKTVGALLALPPAGLRERFGAEAYRLHQMAAGELWAPLDPSKLEEPVAQDGSSTIRKAMPRGCSFSSSKCSIRCWRGLPAALRHSHCCGCLSSSITAAGLRSRSVRQRRRWKKRR